MSYPAPQVRLNDLLDFLANAPPCELVLQRHITNEFAPVVRFEKQEFPSELPPESIRYGRREVHFLHYKERSFGLCIWLHVEIEPGIFGRHRYWSFSVPSGRKHLPPFKRGKQFHSASEAVTYARAVIALMAQDFVGPAQSRNRFTRYALPNAITPNG